MTINELFELEKSISQMVENIKADIIHEMKIQVNPDYKPINSFCGVVKFSALQNSDSWAPEYFIPDAQAMFVESTLKDIKTITALNTKVKELIEKKSIKYKNVVQKLNPITIKVLKKYYKNETHNIWNEGEK